MAVQGRNPTVEYILQNTTYGFTYEGIGDLREYAGEWRFSSVPINDILSAILKNYNGAAAVRILVAPVPHDYVVADNTVGQIQTPLTPGSIIE
jgi:hypothetical protein